MGELSSYCYSRVLSISSDLLFFYVFFVLKNNCSCSNFQKKRQLRVNFFPKVKRKILVIDGIYRKSLFTGFPFLLSFPGLPSFQLDARLVIPPSIFPSLCTKLCNQKGSLHIKLFWYKLKGLRLAQLFNPFYKTRI